MHSRVLFILEFDNFTRLIIHIWHNAEVYICAYKNYFLDMSSSYVISKLQNTIKSKNVKGKEKYTLCH